MGFNSSQKIPTFTKGEVLRADSLSHLVAAMKRMIVGGPGVEVKPMRDQIAINIKQGPIPRAGGGDGVQVYYTAASRALLDAYTDVVVYARGRVIAGDDNGTDYIRNPDNDGWVAANRLE